MDNSTLTALILGIIGTVGSLIPPLIKWAGSRKMTEAQVENLEADTLEKLQDIVGKQADQIEKVTDTVAELKADHQAKINFLNNKVGDLEVDLEVSNNLLIKAKDIIRALIQQLEDKGIDPVVGIPDELKDGAK